VKKIILVIIIFLLLQSSLFAIRYPYPYYPLPEYSSAQSYGVLSVLNNPAALGLYPDIEIMLAHSFDEDNFTGDNTIMFSRQGFGFAWQNYRLSTSDAVNSYTLALGSRLSRGFYLGASYTLMKSKDTNPHHNDHFWNLGILYRPGPITGHCKVAGDWSWSV